MADKPLQGKAGIFRAWDGSLTGPAPGDPGPMAERDHSWSSVKKKQSGKVFTAAEVKQLVEEAIAADREGRGVAPVAQEKLPSESAPAEGVIKIGGK